MTFSLATLLALVCSMIIQLLEQINSKTFLSLEFLEVITFLYLDAEEDFDNNPNTYKFQWEHGYLNGAPFKMEQLCNYYVGEVVTGFQKASLAASGA